MNKLLFIAVLAALAGCAGSQCGSCKTDRSAAAAKSVEPVLERISDPNPFANYDDAMASDRNHPMAVEWQNAHDEEIAAATKPEVLVKFLESDASAEELLAEVKDGYATDPLKSTQIAAIDQLVMCTKCDKAPACRARWRRALVKSAMESKSVYRTLFLLDQLRWCGSADDVQDILAIAAATGEKAIADFAVMVASELKAAK